MPLEGTAALLNGAGSCPSAFLLKCLAGTSQNADTRDIVLRACHWVQSPFNAPKPSMCHASTKASVRTQAASVCPLHNCDEISQAFVFIPFLPLYHSIPNMDNYDFSLAYSFRRDRSERWEGSDKPTFGSFVLFFITLLIKMCCSFFSLIFVACLC